MTLEEFTLELAIDEGDGDNGGGACRICRIPMSSFVNDDDISVSSPPWDEDEDDTGIVRVWSLGFIDSSSASFTLLSGGMRVGFIQGSTSFPGFRVQGRDFRFRV